MAESLSGLLQDVAYMQALPDADLEFLTGLQAQLVAKLRQPIEQAQAAAQAGMAAQPPALGSATPPPPEMLPPSAGGPLAVGGLPMPAGGPPGLPAGPAGAPPGLPPGLRNGIALPPVDELRRLVQGPPR